MIQHLRCNDIFQNNSAMEDTAMGDAVGSKQHPNQYNVRLPHKEIMEEDSVAYLKEIRSNLAKAVLDNDIENCVVWVINLHKYIILYGMSFSKEEHIYLIKVLYGLLTTKNIDPVSLDKFAKVLRLRDIFL